MRPAIHCGSLLAVLLVAVCLGCQSETPDKKPPQSENRKSAPPSGEEKATKEQVSRGTGEQAAPPPSIPKVQLSATDLATCTVKVGDWMPQADLPDLSGKTQSLGSLYGKKLTVVVFWTADSLYSVEELQDLAEGLLGPYAGQGVAVIGINERDKPEVVKAKVELVGAKFPILLDKDGQLFAKVAKAKPGRTYLLGASGKILWFDLEYSRGTRQDLLQAIAAEMRK
ncbi:MAG: TlpA disulfide reductase family protein [Thermoguttaceae bacterium]|jgi:peroxiredoxin